MGLAGRLSATCPPIRRTSAGADAVVTHVILGLHHRSYRTSKSAAAVSIILDEANACTTRYRRCRRRQARQAEPHALASRWAISSLSAMRRVESSATPLSRMSVNPNSKYGARASAIWAGVPHGV